MLGHPSLRWVESRTCNSVSEHEALNTEEEHAAASRDTGGTAYAGEPQGKRSSASVSSAYVSAALETLRSGEEEEAQEAGTPTDSIDEWEVRSERERAGHAGDDEGDEEEKEDDEEDTGILGSGLVMT